MKGKSGFNLDRYVSQEAMALNIREIHNFRIILSIVGGITTGILGVSGPMGFLLFLIYAICGSVILWAKFAASWP